MLFLSKECEADKKAENGEGPREGVRGRVCDGDETRTRWADEIPGRQCMWSLNTTVSTATQSGESPMNQRQSESMREGTAPCRGLGGRRGRRRSASGWTASLRP